jgi:hypothetical protein
MAHTTLNGQELLVIHALAVPASALYSTGNCGGPHDLTLKNAVQFLLQGLQVLRGGGARGDRPAGAVGEQMGQDRDVPARPDGQRRQELLEHAAEAAGQAPAGGRAPPEARQAERQRFFFARL